MFWAQLPILFPLLKLFVSCPPSEPPVTMVRVPQDVGVLETAVASFECELSRPSAEVKWFKVRVHPNHLQQCPAVSYSQLQPPATALPARAVGRSSEVLPDGNFELILPGQDGQELRPGPNCRIYSAGRRRILQLSHCALADAGTYTCDVGGCQASATLHVQGTVPRLLRSCTPQSPVLPSLLCPPWSFWHLAPHQQSARSALCRSCRMSRCRRATMPSSPVRCPMGT